MFSSIKKCIIIHAVCISLLAGAMELPEPLPIAQEITEPITVRFHDGTLSRPLHKAYLMQSKTFAMMIEECPNHQLELSEHVAAEDFRKFYSYLRWAYDIEHQNTTTDELLRHLHGITDENTLLAIAEYANYLDVPVVLQAVMDVMALRLKMPEKINECLQRGSYQLTCNKDIQRIIAKKIIRPALQSYWAIQEKITNDGDGKNPPIKKLLGHTSEVWAVACQNSSDLIASGSSDNTIRICDRKTGVCISLLHGHTGTVNAVCFSTCGNLLASGSTDGTVRIWDVITAKCSAICRGHNGCVVSVRFNETDDKVVSGSRDNTARIWNVATGDCLAHLIAHTKPVEYVSFMHNTVVSGSSDGSMRLWDALSGKCISLLHTPTNFVTAICFDSNEHTMATGSINGTVRIRNAAGNCIAMAQGPASAVVSLSFNKTGDILVSGCSNGNICLWDTSNGKCLFNFTGHTDSVYALSLNEQKDALVSGSLDTSVRVWDIGNPSIKKYFQNDILPEQAALLLYAAECKQKNKPLKLAKLSKKITSTLSPGLYKTIFGLSWWQKAHHTWNGMNPAVKIGVAGVGAAVAVYGAHTLLNPAEKN